MIGFIEINMIAARNKYYVLNSERIIKSINDKISSNGIKIDRNMKIKWRIFISI